MPKTGKAYRPPVRGQNGVQAEARLEAKIGVGNVLVPPVQCP